MARVYSTGTDEERTEAVRMAADAVHRGEVVVLPTDTVYGVGCDAFSATAVQAVLDAKGRGRDMPPPVLVASPMTVDGLALDVPQYARDLMAAFWPGALTLVVRSQPSLHWDLGETRGTVAVRMPDHPVARHLLEAVGPMAVTSANKTGNPPATTATEAAAQLGDAVAVYLDAGATPGETPSTILDCTRERPRLLRAGAIDVGRLAEALGEGVAHDLVAPPAQGA